MSENGGKSEWVRLANLYKRRHKDKGSSLQSNNIAKRMETPDNEYVSVNVWNNQDKDGFLDNSEDAHLVIRRTELDDFIKYLEGLR